jgi:hypothetical protein
MRSLAMPMTHILGSLTTAAVCCGCADWTSRSQEAATLAELSSLPTGIDVSIAEDGVRAVDYGRDPPDGDRFVWRFHPTVRAAQGPLTVEDLGFCIWQNGRWSLVFKHHYPDADSAIEDFDYDFKCGNGRLYLGQPYKGVDHLGANELTAARLKWFIIAVDDDGNRFKGEAELELLAEADPAK